MGKGGDGAGLRAGIAGLHEGSGLVLDGGERGGGGAAVGQVLAVEAVLLELLQPQGERLNVMCL